MRRRKPRRHDRGGATALLVDQLDRHAITPGGRRALDTPSRATDYPARTPDSPEPSSSVDRMTNMKPSDLTRCRHEDARRSHRGRQSRESAEGAEIADQLNAGI